MSEEHHPIDYAEKFAEAKKFDFDRTDENQISMTIKGIWRTYSVALAQSKLEQGDDDNVLRLVLTFEMQPPTDSKHKLYEMLNHVNDQCWMGAFTYWAKQQLMVYRYGLPIFEEGVCAETVEVMINTAVQAAEQYYLAFGLVSWDNKSPKDALQVAIAKAYGRA